MSDDEWTPLGSFLDSLDLPVAGAAAGTKSCATGSYKDMVQENPWIADPLYKPVTLPVKRQRTTSTSSAQPPEDVIDAADSEPADPIDLVDIYEELKRKREELDPLRASC